MLSIKGREPFIRMQLWLTDPTSIEKLQHLKNERREGVKRKRLGGSGFDSSSDRSSPADPSDFMSADSPNSLSKKQRVLFSDEQKEALKIAFTLDPYPSTSAMDFLSQELNLEARTISNWFHNHRMRLKQQDSATGATSFPSPTGRDGQSFDPVKFKLLFHQRMIELRNGSADDNSNGSSNGCGSNPAAAALAGGVTSFLRQFGLPAAMAEGGGLDLTFKKDHDKDSIAASSDEEDGGNAPASRVAAAAAGIIPSAAVLAAAVSASRSRRKPAAPQWLRPAEDEADEAATKKMTINGVCVMNALAGKAADNDSENEEEEKNASRSGSPAKAPAAIESEN